MRRRDAWARWPWPATTAGAFASATWRPSQSLPHMREGVLARKNPRRVGRVDDWSAGGSAAALHARMHAYGTVRGPPTGLAV
jgi:hypothetical protein